MEELIGKRCRVEFDLPAAQWPVPGYPAWVVVLAVSMPMIKMRNFFGVDTFWINCDKIVTISSAEATHG